MVVVNDVTVVVVVFTLCMVVDNVTVGVVEDVPMWLLLLLLSL